MLAGEKAAQEGGMKRNKGSKGAAGQHARRKKPERAAVAKKRAKEFRVSHSAASGFEKGLRGYFEYRDLGIEGATRGKVVSHLIRALPGEAPHGEWHWHDCEVQFVYVLKGWANFEYEGVGEILMQAGTCFYQPPCIRHREIGHSDDVEMLEVVAPANFKTYTAHELG
jgi:mannose-6-phosphate isomerase-like protein (cupin superfamily)